jgi:uncharacterized membrane protein
MADTPERLKLYTDRYGATDIALIRDINRLLGAVATQLKDIETRLALLESAHEAQELTLADHESRITTLEP